MKKYIVLLFMFAFFISLASAAWPSHLISNVSYYYDMGENSTGIAKFLMNTRPLVSNTTNISTVNNPTYTVNGRFGNGTQFLESSNQYGIFQNYQFPTGSPNLTVSVWVNMTSSADNQYILCGGDSSGNGKGFGLGYGYVSGDRKFFFYGQGSNADVVSLYASANNTWHNVVLVSQDNTRKLFIDGNLSNSSTYAYNIASAVIYVGQSCWGASRISGIVDDIAIFDGYAMNDSDAIAMYTNGPFIVDTTPPSVTISAPNTTYTGSQVIPINFTATDNVGVTSCVYNVTRGASTEITDTAIDCSATNNNFTVSGDATYRFSLKVADGFGNVNYSSSYFVTSSYTPPTPGGGGGGGGGGSVIIYDNTRWTYTTESGSESYEFQMSPGTIRTRQLVFKNLGSDEVKITIEPDSSLKDYVTIEQTHITLPLIKDVATKVTIVVDLPKDYTGPGFSGNIVAKDDKGNTGTVSLIVKNTPSSFLLKILSSRKVGDLIIPYFLISTVAAIVSSFIAFMIFKQSDAFAKTRGAASFIVGLAAFFIILLFV